MADSCFNLSMDGYHEEEKDECSINVISKNLLTDLKDSPLTKMPPPPLPDASNEPGAEKMRVYLRVRPLREDEIKAGESKDCVNVPDKTQVKLIAPKGTKTYEHSAHGCGKVVNTFSFSQVYDENVTQKELFDDSMYTTCKDFIDGQNCLVFAYGVTNSGKTYTMQGPPKDVGIIPRSLELIFNSVEAKLYQRNNLKPCMYCGVKVMTTAEVASHDKFKNVVLNSAARMTDSEFLYASNDSLGSTISSGGEGDTLCLETDTSSLVSTEEQGDVKFSMWVSFAEIYNESIYDLLEPLSKTNIKRKALLLREDKQGNPFIKDLKYIQVCCADEALKVLIFGQKNLQFACTKLNENSSRSHCIFNVKMIRVKDTKNPSIARVSQLSFCDLAGSERFQRTKSSEERLKEAANINTSLLTLGRCIQLLRQNQNIKMAGNGKERVVPYRESKLTRLFQTYFSGKGKAAMLVNVSPAASSFDENIQALKFSAIAKQVQFVPDKPSQEPSRKRKKLDDDPTEEPAAKNRNTIAWATEEDLDSAESDNMPTIDEEQIESALTENERQEYMEAIDALKAKLMQVTQSLVDERKSRKNLDAKIREQISKEMTSLITEIEGQHETMLEEERNRLEDYYEDKMSSLTNALTGSIRRRKDKNKDGAEQEATVSLEVYKAEKIKLEKRDQEIEELKTKIQTLSDVHTDEISTLRDSLADAEAKLVLASAEPRPITPDLQSNEVFLAVSRQLEEAKQQLREKETEMDELKTTLEEAGQTFEAQASNVKQLETDLQAALKSVSDFESSTKTKDDKIAELEDANRIHCKSEIVAKELETKCTKLELTLSETLRERGELAGKCSELDVKCSKFSAKVIAGQATLNDLKTQLVKAKADTGNEELEAKCVLLERQLSEAKVELTKHAEETINSERQIAELEQEVLALTRGLQAADKVKETEFAGLQGRFTDVENTLTATQRALQEAMEQIEQNEQTHRQIHEQWNHELAAIVTGLRSGDEKMDLVHGQCDEMNSNVQALRKLTADAVETKKKYEDMMKEVNRLQTLLRRRSTELHGDMSTVQTQLLTAQSESERLKADKTKLESKAKDHHTEVVALRMTITSLEESLKTAADDKGKLSDELKVWEDKVKDILSTKESLENQLTGRIDEIKQKQTEIDEMKSKLGNHSEKDEAIVALRQELQQLNDELSSSQAALRGTENKMQQYSAMSKKVSEVNAQLDQQKQLHELATVKLESLTGENKKLKESQAESTSLKVKLEEKIAVLQREIEQSEFEMKSLKATLETTQKNAEKSDSVDQEEARVMRKLTEDYNKAVEELAGIQSEAKSVNQQFETFKSASRKKETELADQIKQLEQQLADSTERDQTAAANTKELERLTAVIEKKEQMVCELKSALDEQENTMNVQDEVIESKENEIKNLLQETQVLQTKCDELTDIQAEKSTFTHRITTLQEERNVLCESNKALEARVEELRARVAHLNSEYASLTESNRALQCQIEDGLKEGDGSQTTISLQASEIKSLKLTMSDWRVEKDTLTAQMEKVLADKDDKIKELRDDSTKLEDRQSEITKLEERITRKDKIILQLEQKIRSQESIIHEMQNAVDDLDNRRPTRSTRFAKGSVSDLKIHELESELKQERRTLTLTQAQLDRVLCAKDEQMADLKEANQELQRQLERLETSHKSKPSRPSDRFKDPAFVNDNELSRSTLELDVTPGSSKGKKKASTSTLKTTQSARKSARLAQKENRPVSTTKSSVKSVAERIRTIVENTRSPLASPAKKLLVHMSPLRAGDDNAIDPTTDPKPERRARRRKLYTSSDEALAATPVPAENDDNLPSLRRTRAARNDHKILISKLGSLK